MTQAPSPQVPPSAGATNPDGLRRAIRAYERGKLDKAIGCCEQILATHPDHFDAVHLLAVVKSKAGQPDEALRFFEKALRLRPGRAEVHNNHGSALADLGRFEDALAAYDRALLDRPDFADAHNNRGCVLMFMDRYEEALTNYGRALVLVPDSADYMNNMGRAFTRLLRYDEACACFDDAIEQKPKFVEAILNKGRALEELRCWDDAIFCFGQAIEISDDMTEPILRRAHAFVGAERYQDALSDYRRALRLAPERHDIHLRRSEALVRLGRTEEAFGAIDKAEALGVDRIALLMTKSVAFDFLERRDEALAVTKELVEKAPDHPDAHNLRGLVLMGAECFEEAIASYKTALHLRPDFPPAEWNLGYLSLLQGRFIEGFRHYEGRRRQEGTRWTRLEGPEWRGQSLVGKRILVYAEQAFGDTIHFARYIGVFARMGAHVVFGLYPQLAALMRGIDGTPEITLQGENLPRYDYHLPLMSAPFVLGHDEKDTPDTPYVFADAERVTRWAKRLPDAPFKVGIAWQGSAAIPGRAIPLAAFAPLASIPGVSLISLQKSDGLDQLGTLPDGMTVETMGAGFDSGPDAFLDTAAVMMSLDLVISCDTAVAHLAGALGRPLWVILKTVPDWRWMLKRPDSPWYPTARLFRRKENESWSETVKDVTTALGRLCKEKLQTN